MIQIPANLAQRILDAARIAALIHQETDQQAGGAGAAGVDRDAPLSTDGTATVASRLAGWLDDRLR